MKIGLVTMFLLGACAGGAVTAVAPVRASLAGAVVPLSATERRVAPNGQSEVRRLFQGENAFLGRLEMAPGAQVPENVDDTEEYVHVLEGEGEVVIDGQRFAVRPGTTIFMPAQARVSYQNGDQPLVAIQVFAGPGPAQKYEAWTRR